MSRPRPITDWVVLQEPSTPVATPPDSPLVSPGRRPSRTAQLSAAELDAQASQLILQAIGRQQQHPSSSSSTATSAVYRPQTSRPIPLRTQTPPPSAFGKISFSSVMGLARGRSLSKSRSSSVSATSSTSAAATGDDRGRTRSISPFARRNRSPSVGVVGPLRADESDWEDEGGDTAREDGPGAAAGVEEWSDNDDLDGPDALTLANTTHNSLPDVGSGGARGPDEHDEPDPLGEGVNVVVPAKTEPYFEPRLARPRRGHARKASKSTATHEQPAGSHSQLPLLTGRPHFQRDRCSVRLVQGDYKSSGRRYVVASDRSEESRYAMEWAIGTVLRDGDELFVVTVVESDTKLDPTQGTQPADRVSKLKNQQERQTLAFLLVKQATLFLQRTRLNVAITCQAWHAKNSRHMILDIVDYYEPVMLIVGSRGVGQLKGILLGSTAHYLIHKSSVPVMVARRRLKRPFRRGTAHLTASRTPRVPLAQAAIDKAGPGRDRDVADMRQALAREEAEEIARRDSLVVLRPNHEEDAAADEEDGDDDDSPEEGRGKVAG